MKPTSIVLASLLASVTKAQPHRQHQHKHVKKDVNVVWITDWVSVTETVGYTTTIWVDEGFVPPTATISQSSSPSQAGGEFFQPVAPEQPSSSSSSIYVAPTPSSTYVAPAPSVPAASDSEVQSPTSTSIYVPPATTEPVYTAPTSAASVAAPSSSAAAGVGSGSISASCSSGSPCTGDFTYYDAGLGACGITNDGTTDKVVALSVQMMGSQSNSGDGQDANPYCGKTITVEYNGKTTTAKVVDKCQACSYDSVDLSKAAYADLADEALGRAPAKWWFN